MTVSRKKISNLKKNKNKIVSVTKKNDCYSEVFHLTERISLEKFTLPHTKKKVDEIEEQFLLHEHKTACMLPGYMAIADVVGGSVCGHFISGEEKKRQLAGASDKKKKQLLKQWGKQDAENSGAKTKRKLQLRAGLTDFPAIILVRQDNPRGLEIALQMASNTQVEPVEADPELDKRTIRKQLKERDQLRQHRQVVKKAKKRKEVLQQVFEEKQQRKTALIISSLPEELKEKLAAAQRAVNKPVAATSAPAGAGLPSDGQFVFNIQTEKKIKEKEKKKKRSVQELKAELKAQLDKKKLLSQLKTSGEGELAQEVLTKHGWAEASKKVEGVKVDQISSLSRELKRALHKQKNKGKKLEEVLKRQKQDKHKKTLKRMQNLRTRRVGRLAVKMKHCAKKGHIVPGFM